MANNERECLLFDCTVECNGIWNLEIVYAIEVIRKKMKIYMYIICMPL